MGACHSNHRRTTTGGSNANEAAPLIKGEPVTITSRYDSRASGYGGRSIDDSVFVAVSSENGVINLDRATPSFDKGRYSKSSPFSEVSYTITNGIQVDKHGRVTDYNINWNNVNEVKGANKSMNDFLESKGLRYNPDTQTHQRGYKGYTITNGVAKIGQVFPDSLDGVTRISGNTYGFRDKIKRAGFVWDGATKTWVKK